VTAENITGVLIAIGVLVLAVLLVVPNDGSPRGAARERIRLEQEASISRHEVGGVTLPRAIDLIGSSLLTIDRVTSAVVRVTKKSMGLRGHASIDSELTPTMVSASWGAPDEIGRSGIGLKYVYYQPPYGEVHVLFSNYRDRAWEEQVASWLKTVLYVEYFKREYPEWTDATYALVMAEGLALGMTDEMAEVSWGSPSDINRTVDSGGMHEQWVYRDILALHSTRYIYFENGILTSWQD
jgi:hypothetical protein